MAGIDDDAGFFPGLDEVLASLGSAELEDEVVQIAKIIEEGCGVCFHFLEKGAAVDDLASRVVEEGLEGLDGGGESCNPGGGTATPGGSSLAGGAGGEIPKGGGLTDQI